MKILLATDGSSFSETATEFLASYFKPDRTEVLVLHASGFRGESDFRSGSAPRLDCEGLQGAEAIVSHAANRLAQAGFKVSTQIVRGDARFKIVETAGAWSADMLLLGSHGRTGLDRLFLGSVSEGVARSAPCSVAVIRMNAARLMDGQGEFAQPNGKRNVRLLLAIDDSKKLTESAIQAIERQMYASRTEICVLHVVEPVYSNVASYSYVAHARDVDVAQRRLMEHGEELVAGAERILSDAGFNVVTAVDSGDARVKILDRADEWMADLVVVSSHGHTGLDRFLIGSVSENVARHVHCSVEIVRPVAVTAQSAVRVMSPAVCQEAPEEADSFCESFT